MTISSGNAVCDALAMLSFTGNIVPLIWFTTIVKKTLKNPKPYLLAINILADIVYWYRPTEERDPETGRLIGMKTKFQKDMLQRSYRQICDLFGCSKGEAQKALVFLEQLGVIKRVFRNIDTQAGTLYNVMFLDLDVHVLKTLTYPTDDAGDLCSSTTDQKGSKSLNGTDTFCDIHENASDICGNNGTPPVKFHHTSPENIDTSPTIFYSTCEEISSHLSEKEATPPVKFIETNTETTAKTTAEITAKTTTETTAKDFTSKSTDEEISINLSDRKIVESDVPVYKEVDLDSIKAIPNSVLNNPKLLKAAILNVINQNYDTSSLVNHDPLLKTLMTEIPRSLVKMICAQKPMAYGNSQVLNGRDVLNALNNCILKKEFSNFIALATKNYADAAKTKDIRNPAAYLAAVLWNALEDYRLVEETELASIDET